VLEERLSVAGSLLIKASIAPMTVGVCLAQGLCGRLLTSLRRWQIVVLFSGDLPPLTSALVRIVDSSRSSREVRKVPCPFWTASLAEIVWRQLSPNP
jgi:hypothetical protein